VIRFWVGFTVLLLFAGVFAVFFFSWLPDPLLSKYDLLPDWLARWTDAPENDTIRTAVPFVGLGFITGSYLSATDKDWRWWLNGWTGLALIALIAEAGQLTLPHRNFDWNDVAWGTIGSLTGLLLAGSGFAIAKVVMKNLRYTDWKSFEKQ
jgi:VanZ family protein